MRKRFKLFSKQTILVSLTLVLAFALRIPFFSEPLDYDEGVYAFWAFFAREDKFFSSSLPSLKLPGIIFTYLFLDRLFPGQIAAFRIAAAFLSILATFGIYKLGKLLHSYNMGIFSALIFALFTSQISRESPANTEFFMIPFTILAFWLFWLFLKKRKLIWLVLSSLSAGVAFFYKQVVVFEVAFLGLWLLVNRLLLKKNGWKGKLQNVLMESFVFLIGFLIPLLVGILFFFFKDELTNFWWQSFGSGHSYVGLAWKGQDWFVRLKNASKTLGFNFWPFWLTSLGGLIIVLLKRQKESVFLAGWTLFALIGACFNGWFFPHYFIQLIPPVSLLSGFFLTHIFQWIKPLFRSHKILTYILSGVIFSVAFFLVFKNQLSPYSNYLQMVRGKIKRIEYLKKIGFDVAEDGWLPFYESVEYLKATMEEKDSFFAWSTTSFPYYLIRKNPPTSFTHYYSFLDYQSMLPTYRGWEFDFEANRQQLMKELYANPPTYVLIHVNPEQIFDQMLLFEKFSNFISLNYKFEKQFGNLLILKIKSRGEFLESESELPIIPFGLIKRFSAITEIEEKNSQTKIVFEPMVNPEGALRSFKTIYPEVIKIDFEPITLKSFGKDGYDFVGVALQQPSGTVDLHLKIKGVKKHISFVRVKIGEITWNNRAYGVNPALKVIQTEAETIDLFFEPPSGWRGKTLNTYIIYQDGSISSQDIKLSQSRNLKD